MKYSPGVRVGIIGQDETGKWIFEGWAHVKRAHASGPRQQYLVEFEDRPGEEHLRSISEPAQIAGPEAYVKQLNKGKP